MIFTLSLCYHYYQYTELTSNSIILPKQTTAIKKDNDSLDKVSETLSSVKISDIYSRTKILTLISYIDQYKSAEPLSELENKHSMNDYSVIMNIIHFYAKNSAILECITDCPNKIDKDATDLLEAYITEIRYLHQEMFTSELSDILYIISNYKGK